MDVELEKIYTLVYLVVAWSGLIVEYWVTIRNAEKGSALIASWKYFSYYTILSNILVAICITAIFFSPASSAGLFFNSSYVIGGISLHVVVLGVVYHFMYGYNSTAFWSNFSTLILHYVTPGLALFYWLLFANKDGLSYQVIIYWLIYPVLYFSYTLTHGIWSKFYPYPFVNVSESGWVYVLRYMLGLIVVIAIGGLVLVLAAKYLF
jgi:hypothetical protein